MHQQIYMKSFIMKNVVVLLLAALNGVWTILSPCKDSGVWIADGLVSCQYLEKSSAYGFHKNPAGFCKQYFAECCLSCSKLQKNGYTSVTNRHPSAAATTLPSILSQQFPVTIHESRTKIPCKDSGVWIADGLVSCIYLERPSVYGIHNNPREFCAQYYLECCLTCTKFKENGYTSVTNRYPSEAATTLASILSPQFPVTIRESRTNIPCKDSGVWKTDGVVSCIYLELPSVYGIHKTPREFCAEYYRECCLTCTKFKNKDYTETSPLTSTTSVMTSSKEIIHSRSNNVITLLDTIAPQRTLPNVQREIMSLHKQIIRFRKFLLSFQKKLKQSFHEHCKDKTK